MDSLDRLLRDDLNRLLDRIIASAQETPGTTGPPKEDRLRVLMDLAEGHLSEVRLRLLRDYAEWRQGMDECESLWALSRLRGGETLAPEEPVEVEVLRAA